jgi:acetylornithine deacetylase/succinyl-diaminopimelate desuccinylase-like protein
VPERSNLVARLRGTGGGSSLALLSHTDVVPADAREWSADPFGGELRDGVVWGRGALDMKGQVAASAVALASLAREGWRHGGDLVFIAAADEEVGNGFGLDWLVREHPDACRADYAINEGGGDRVEIAGLALYLCATAEKMSAPFLLRVHGRSGHASMPGIADNALVKAAPLIELLAAYAPAPELSPETEAFLAAIWEGEPPAADEALALARSISPLAAELVEPLLGTTVAPTMATASSRRNVVPSTCEIAVDSRILPGVDPDRVLEEIRDFLGEGDYEIEPIERRGGTRSRLDGELWKATEAFVRELEPGARLAPICTAGFTDSHWMRMAFNAVAYGFYPSRFDPETAARLIHSADERVPVEDVALGVDYLRFMARVVCR